MWDHIKDIGEGQVQVQVGALRTGLVEVAKDGSAVQMQATSGVTANKEVRAAGESRWRRQASEQV